MSELKKIRQSDDPKKFMELFKLTRTSSMPSPQFPDYEIEFEGLEALYVNDLENQVEELKKHARELRERVWWLQDREYRKSFQELEKAKP